jgi:hypothetical protein
MSCKINNKVHYIKGVMWDMIIDCLAAERSDNDQEQVLQEAESIMNKLEKVNILKFVKILLQKFETMTKE